MLKQEIKGGDHFISVQFPNQLSSSTTTWLEIECTDAFTSNHEGIVLLVDQPTKEATIEAIFPENRLPTSFRAIYRYSGKEEELPPPTISRNILTWTCSYRFRQVPFGEYELSWFW